MQPLSISNYFDILSQSQKAYSRYLEPVCRKWELTRSELDVLLFLYNNPDCDRAADIVTRRGMTKSHVSLSVANLAELGHLQRSFSPVDRRNAHLSLTEQGRIIAAEGREAQLDFFRRLHQGIPEAELRIWQATADKICQNIETISKSLTTV